MRCGIVDVDSWLDSVTPQQFDEFLAMESLEPSNSWDHTGTVAAAAHNASLAFGGKALSPSDFVPKPRAEQHEATTDVSAWEAAICARFGGRK